MNTTDKARRAKRWPEGECSACNAETRVTPISDGATTRALCWECFGAAFGAEEEDDSA